MTQLSRSLSHVSCAVRLVWMFVMILCSFYSLSGHHEQEVDSYCESFLLCEQTEESHKCFTVIVVDEAETTELLTPHVVCIMWL